MWCHIYINILCFERNLTVERYEELELEVVVFEAADVIANSDVVLAEDEVQITPVGCTANA